jgi:hypothetical protein
MLRFPARKTRPRLQGLLLAHALERKEESPLRKGGAGRPSKMRMATALKTATPVVQEVLRREGPLVVPAVSVC